MKIIYCADGNKRYAEIAKECGFLLGARLPGTVYNDIHFADQDWKNPDRQKYMEALEQYRPYMATVLDLEREEQYTEVMSWAEEAAQYVEMVLVIPKVSGIIPRIPKTINGKHIRLAYSVPTRYGKTEISTEEFGSRDVHLLGGSPHAQFSLCGIHFPKEQMRFFIDTPALNVKSIDGNMHLSMASRFCQFWCPGNAYYAQNKYWPTLAEENGGPTGKPDGNYVAFRKSCENIIGAWNDI